jgi:hypothetical protein
MPEIFVNSNKFDFGRNQENVQVNDVILPPWAKTPEEFVRLHREALGTFFLSFFFFFIKIEILN